MGISGAWILEARENAFLMKEFWFHENLYLKKGKLLRGFLTLAILGMTHCGYNRDVRNEPSGLETSTIWLHRLEKNLGERHLLVPSWPMMFIIGSLFGQISFFVCSFVLFCFGLLGIFVQRAMSKCKIIPFHHIIFATHTPDPCLISSLVPYWLLWSTQS